MIVENVRGAQKWVGRARANFGSFYLWGDVGMVGRRVVAGIPRFGSTGISGKAVKQHGSGREWFAGEGKISRVTSSNTPARKAASAAIAKIPFPLAQHIAKVFYPRPAEHAEEVRCG